MNKLVKGGLAAAAGIALLMGGAGSLAYWSATGTTSAGTIQTGHLKLTAGTAGSWNITKLVPGDTATYSQTFTLDAVGDNIRVHLAAAVGSGTLPTDITQSVSYVIDGNTTTPWNGSGTKDFTAGTHTVVATVSVAYASSSTATAVQDQTYTPGTVTVTATQY